MKHASRKFWCYNTCLVFFLGFSTLLSYNVHAHMKHKGDSGLSQGEIQNLNLLKKSLINTLQQKYFFTYQHDKYIRSIYQDINHIVEAILLDYKTEEAHYTFLKLMKILQSNFEIIDHEKSTSLSLRVILDKEMLFNINNKTSLKKIRDHVKKFYCVSLKEKKNLYKDFFLAKVITQNTYDPIIHHLMTSYHSWKDAPENLKETTQTWTFKQKTPSDIHKKKITKIEFMINESLPKLTYKAQKRLLYKLQSINQSDLNLLFLFSQIENLDFSELLRGAHFILNDHAKFYLKLQKHHIVKTHLRSSSHYPQEPSLQFGLAEPSPLFHEILFGKILDKQTQQNLTWFQAEKYGFGKLKKIGFGILRFHYPSNRYFESWSHLKSFSDHIKSNLRQVGPYGFSSHSEKINSAIFLEG